ncbi:hypothetical protein Syun_018203 [Stephania yunnanensis]|uniref:Uncharacterized protein n=1 Tax=Stephania yunnanensis TaxID=152371 RepID=A0AAP0IU30_9MAGN
MVCGRERRRKPKPPLRNHNNSLSRFLKTACDTCAEDDQTVVMNLLTCPCHVSAFDWVSLLARVTWRVVIGGEPVVMQLVRRNLPRVAAGLVDMTQLLQGHASAAEASKKGWRMDDCHVACKRINTALPSLSPVCHRSAFSRPSLLSHPGHRFAFSLAGASLLCLLSRRSARLLSRFGPARLLSRRSSISAFSLAFASLSPVRFCASLFAGHRSAFLSPAFSLAGHRSRFLSRPAALVVSSSPFREGSISLSLEFR